MGVCTKERKGVAAEVLMATPCTNSLGGESEGHKHEGCGGRRLCWKFAAVSWSGADDDVYYYIRWRERDVGWRLKLVGWRLKLERRWVLLKRPRGDRYGMGEGR